MACSSASRTKPGMRRPAGAPVSRRDILRALIDAEAEKFDAQLSSEQIRDIALANIASAGLSSFPIEVKVVGDEAEISGEVGSEVIARALLAAVKASPGIRAVKNGVRVIRYPVGGVI